jgi:hypothetical protein
LSAGAFNVAIPTWKFRDNAQLDSYTYTFGFPGMLTGEYNKTLVGWANNVDAGLSAVGRTVIFQGNTYDATDYSAEFPGARFTDAVSARAFLVGNRSVIVSSAADPTADGTYLYNAATLTYDNSVSGWYFIRVGNIWELRDDLDAVQDSSSGNQDEPWLETGWTTDLLGATILSGGAFWTISGDASV